MADLPLFPLGTVLVPGARMPLRIFEARYVTMLRDLLDGTRPPEFGVVAIRSGHEVGEEGVRALFDIGCVAVLEQVEDRDDGTYSVVARGAGRFRLDRLSGASPYLVGQVTRLEESDGDPERCAALARAVRSHLLAYRLLLGGSGDIAEATGAGTRPADARLLSYRVGELVLLPLADRQALLAAPDTCARLDLARRLVRRERELVGRLRAVPRPLDLEAVNPN